MMADEKQKILATDIAGEWSDHFDRSIRSESVRAKVVLSACYLDDLLRELIAIVLKPHEGKKDSLLDGPQAPLSSLSARIEIAGRMLLIPKEVQRSLHLIRKIRNEFAHNLTTCDFSDQKIVDWNKELHNLNDVATPERRLTFSEGPIGDFEKSVSWLIYFLKDRIRKVPTSCPRCGSEMEHRMKLQSRLPDDH